MLRILLSAILILTNAWAALSQNATDIVRKADEKMRGEKSSYSEMTMRIVRPKWERSISFKSWSKGTELSLVYITDPAKEKGQAFLKIKREMWSWNPTINRTVKLPPSMLSQGWMGSDFTNDDLLNQRSIVVDYIHSITGTENIDGEECWKITLLPKPNAPVVWGKIVMWITKKHYLILKSEYYDEDQILVKTELASQIKQIGGRTIPTVYELLPAEEPGNKTIVELNKIEFNININDSFFSLRNLTQAR
ncbi:outer membrane lipoprotein-sorting protein [Tenuifilum thalassicum]|uniref:Outer membrane lipoprotein-sorting protein n=1 Tax=Tenuifilum thalassicum TaxID=2590900 RepID=A0A7D4BKX3_9BACT|nr:outer membrane lipoprotein-sorting protein [Tenuifilum thalassicum]QKG80539.1 outer membrane lipoprotein-sorting protein [Tenuifilum thalassicum]